MAQIAYIAGVDFRNAGFPLTDGEVHLGESGVDFNPARRGGDFSNDFSDDFRIGEDE